MCMLFVCCGFNPGALRAASQVGTSIQRPITSRVPPSVPSYTARPLTTSQQFSSPQRSGLPSSRRTSVLLYCFIISIPSPQPDTAPSMSSSGIWLLPKDTGVPVPSCLQHGLSDTLHESHARTTSAKPSLSSSSGISVERCLCPPPIGDRSTTVPAAVLAPIKGLLTSSFSFPHIPGSEKPWRWV
ncbi:uncharacterized protein B0H64DRAFT_159210 [Chaetomium fimeti]|uniref:Uncharacterized protein n=1 Tax=Chaetomium fimeti TaxID=1854472 RepID=A0AAE0LSR2_9PEZI|nr:hypothetical protein B0H64DRAFT_159210 [Chaetomium fimeti]